MKAKQLMLGNYALYNGLAVRVRNIHDNVFLDGGDESVEVVYDDGVVVLVDPCSLEPIPITQDFLEKNFEKKTFFGIFDDYFDLTIREYSDSLYVVDYHCCEMSLPDQHVTVCFVHELQHFMNHCAIEKEIKL